MLAINDLSFDLENLTPETIHGVRHGKIHIVRIRRARHRVVVPVDDDFAAMSMMLFDAQNDVSLDRSVEHTVNLLEMFVNVLLDGWGNCELTAGKLYLHRSAPFFPLEILRHASQQRQDLMLFISADDYICKTGRVEA
jgi:hypothetical protein